MATRICEHHQLWPLCERCMAALAAEFLGPVTHEELQQLMGVPVALRHPSYRRARRHGCAHQERFACPACKLDRIRTRNRERIRAQRAALKAAKEPT